MKTLDEIESLVKAGCVNQAVDELNGFLDREPEDDEARILLGVCSQLKGDTDGFCRIYNELRPTLSVREAAGEISSVTSRWRHYRKVAAYLVTVGLVSFVEATIQPALADGQEPLSVRSTAEAVSKIPATADQIALMPEFRNFPEGTNVIAITRADGTRIWVARERQPFCIDADDVESAPFPSEQRFNAIRQAISLLNRAIDDCPNIGKKSRLVIKKRRKQVVREDISRVGNKGTVEIYLAVDERVERVGSGEDGTKYNMGGRPMTKYNMGGRPFSIDDDF